MPPWWFYVLAGAHVAQFYLHGRAWRWAKIAATVAKDAEDV